MQAVCPGTFDPITNGHLDIIKRALRVFDSIIIAVGENPNKKALFTTDERKDMVKQAVKNLNVEVDSFSGLLVNYLKKKNLKTIIRSLRAVSDFDYEFQMTITNRELDNNVDTVFLMTDKEYFYLNSGLVKDIAKHNGSLSKLVPGFVEKKLKEKFK